MKKKTLALLCGITAALALGAGTAQAETYSYDLGDGFICYSYEGSSHSSDETSVADQWREQIRERIAYLEQYGVSYDAENDRILYQGQHVRWLIDQKADGTYKAIESETGDIDLYTVRTEDGQLTGVRIAAQQEFDERTRKDEEAEAATRAGSTLIAMEAGDAVTEDIGKGTEKTLEGALDFELAEQIDVCGETASVQDAFDSQEWETLKNEYEDAGIFYDEENGCWLWGQRPVYWLVDENGSMSTYGFDEAVKNKIYLVVKRDEDGKISEVTQVSIEDAMTAQIKNQM